MADEGGGAPAIGIDLGTTNSCVAVWRHGEVEIIPNDFGMKTTPSYVAFTENGILVGNAAKSQAGINPKNTVYDAKRIIGRRFSDSIVQEDKNLWSFEVVSDADDNPVIQVKYQGEIQQYAPERISSIILAKMKDIAENYLETTVKNAVITVPAYFTDSQCRATRDAGIAAGLNVLHILQEPMAAVIAYKHSKRVNSNEQKNVLVFDLGGGTLDVCIVTLDEDAFSVKAIAGHNHIGGEDFDDMMVKHFIKEVKQMYQKDITSTPKAIRRLRTACERTKRGLSVAISERLEVDTLVDDKDFEYDMTRKEFEDINESFFKICIESTQKCLSDANMKKVDIHEVVLVGGSTRIPYVQEKLAEFFHEDRLCKALNADEAIAYGASIYAAMLSGDDQDRVKPVKLSVVTPLSLGVQVEDAEMQVVIPRNTIIPTRAEKIFTTTYNKQKMIKIQVYEGEGTKLEENDLLAKFFLSDISPASKGKNINVCFEIDANGILNVTAKDVIAGPENKITITKYRGKVNSQKIQDMVENEEQHKRQMTRKGRIAIRMFTKDELVNLHRLDYNMGTFDSR